MVGFAVIRQIHLLPGREEQGVRWLQQSEIGRRQAGQKVQYLLKSIVDSSEYTFIQIWESRAAYDQWRRTPERQQLADERQRYFTHEPTSLYEVLL